MKITITTAMLMCISICSNAQIGQRSNRQLEQDKLYEVMIGTNKTNASFNNTDGFTIKDNDIRIVGFLHRYNKIEFDQIYVETKRDTTILDQQTMKGRSINASWKDFYIKLKDIVYSDHYSISVYSSPDKKLLGTKYFYIKEKK
jgi:hypothetical protein